jgi:hypothetical protein
VFDPLLFNLESIYMVSCGLELKRSQVNDQTL